KGLHERNRKRESNSSMPNSAKTLMPRGWTPAQRASAAVRGYGYRHRVLREQVLKMYPICFWCGKEKSTERDHLLSLRNGGEDTIENSVGACKSCNSARARQK